MTAAEYVQGLRDFADWAEQHPAMIATDDRGHIVLVAAGGDVRKFESDRRILGADLPVEVGKTYAEVHRRFGPIDVQVYIGREYVCRPETTTVETTEWVYDEALTVAGEVAS